MKRSCISTPALAKLSGFHDESKNAEQTRWQWFLRRAALWLDAKGANGGILKNWQIIALTSLNLCAWFNAARISTAVARLLPRLFPKGARRPGSSNTFMDKFVGWSLENGAVWTLCNLRSLLPHPEPVPEKELAKGTQRSNFFRTLLVCAKNIAISIASNLIVEQGAVLLLHLASTRLYAEVPHFTSRHTFTSAHPFTFRGLSEWLRGNSVLQLVGGGLFLGVIESFIPVKVAEEINAESFNLPWCLPKFFRDFALFRVIVDVCFYLGHRALHVNPWIYENVHKRHHTDYTTNLQTNFKFTPLDLFVESALPIFVSLGTLRAIGTKLSRFEIHLFMTYISWHELGTHLGKPLHIISTYAPLSILYNSFSDFDRHSVEFHEVHHNRRHCNYGITQWIDALMGSRRLKSSA